MYSTGHIVPLQTSCRTDVFYNDTTPHTVAKNTRRWSKWTNTKHTILKKIYYKRRWGGKGMISWISHVQEWDVKRRWYFQPYFNCSLWGNKLFCCQKISPPLLVPPSRVEKTWRLFSDVLVCFCFSGIAYIWRFRQLRIFCIGLVVGWRKSIDSGIDLSVTDVVFVLQRSLFDEKTDLRKQETTQWKIIHVY